jgi:hypothetical protein
MRDVQIPAKQCESRALGVAEFTPGVATVANSRVVAPTDIRYRKVFDIVSAAIYQSLESVIIPNDTVVTHNHLFDEFVIHF